MSHLKLRVGGHNYDRVGALFDGRVKFEGVDAVFDGAGIVSEIFERMVRDRAYDVSELGLTFYLRTLELDDPPFIAIPVFPNRVFRHSAVFINTASGIRSPQDLAGKTIGEFGLYGHDAGVWPKGILSDDYGVKPEQSRWIIGAADWYMPPFAWIPQPHPANVEVSPVPQGKALGEMLETGEIDALISAWTPKGVLAGSAAVARLFPDYEAVEREYFQRTGIFPIMHTVVIRREVLEKNPGLAKVIYKGYCDAKDMQMEQYRQGLTEQNIDIMAPWFSRLLEENGRILPRDWWPYGMEANRKALDTYLRYFHEQGLSKRRWTCEEIFVPELLTT